MQSIIALEILTALAELCNEHQRCGWHFVRDLNYTMWQDGAAKMARIIIKRFTSVAQWETYWKDRLKIEGKVIMLLKEIKAIAPQPLGR